MGSRTLSSDLNSAKTELWNCRISTTFDFWLFTRNVRTWSSSLRRSWHLFSRSSTRSVPSAEEA